MDENSTTAKPPYGSFQTFWAFQDEILSKPLPPQIDRSLLNTKSGTDQAFLLGATKFFGFISEDLAVTPLLQDWQEYDAEARKKSLGSLVLSLYPSQMAVSAQTGTEKQLLESFEQAFEYTGETRRKAATFFLHAARTAGLPLSVHFPATRGGSGSGTKSGARKRSVRRPKVDPPAAPPAPTIGDTGDTYKVTLKAGGSVTLTVSVSHFALSKNRTDRDFVNGLIDALTDYGDVETIEAEAPEPAAEGEAAE